MDEAASDTERQAAAPENEKNDCDDDQHEQVIAGEDRFGCSGRRPVSVF
jgi:hypothetical protein